MVNSFRSSDTTTTEKLSCAVGSLAQSATTDRHYFHTVVKGGRLGAEGGSGAVVVVEKVKVKPTIKHNMDTKC